MIKMRKIVCCSASLFFNTFQKFSTMDVSLISSVALFFGTLLLTVQWLLSWIATNWKRSRPPYPPCLPALPIIGSLLFMPRDFQVLPDFFMKTAAKLGSIFAYHSGSRWYALFFNSDSDLWATHKSWIFSRFEASYPVQSVRGSGIWYSYNWFPEQFLDSDSETLKLLNYYSFAKPF